MDERAKKRRRRRFLAYLHYWHALFGEIQHEAYEGHEVKHVIPFVIFVCFVVKSSLKIKHGASQYAFWVLCVIISRRAPGRDGVNLKHTKGTLKPEWM